MKNLKFLLIGILVFQFLNTGITQNSNQTSITRMNTYKELKGDDLVGEVFCRYFSRSMIRKRKKQELYINDGASKKSNI